MTAYLLAYRAPRGYAPGPGTFDAAASSHLKLATRLKDRGSVAMPAAALEPARPGTCLGRVSQPRGLGLLPRRRARRRPRLVRWRLAGRGRAGR